MIGPGFSPANASKRRTPNAKAARSSETLPNMQPPIYLDYNATTPVDERVLTRMLPFFSERFGNVASRDHAFGWDAAEAVEEAREYVADLINAKPQEIVFTGGATESINCALRRVTGLKRPCRLITCLTEHEAVLSILSCPGDEWCYPDRISIRR